MGALTLKPSAYRSRPWELIGVPTTNFFTGTSENIILHLRDGVVHKITSPGWLVDRVRFGHDGFRRQRLVTPLVSGCSSGWVTATAVWFALTYHRGVTFRADGMFDRIGWLARVYGGLSHREGPSLVVGLDTRVSASVLHVSHGGVHLRDTAVVFPVWNCPEEAGLVTPPTGATGVRAWSTVVAQVLGSTVLAASGKVVLAVNLGYGATGVGRAVFQVSPIQQLLQG